MVSEAFVFLFLFPPIEESGCLVIQSLCFSFCGFESEREEKFLKTHSIIQGFSSRSRTQQDRHWQPFLEPRPQVPLIS